MRKSRTRQPFLSALLSLAILRIVGRPKRNPATSACDAVGIPYCSRRANELEFRVKNTGDGIQTVRALMLSKLCTTARSTEIPLSQGSGP